MRQNKPYTLDMDPIPPPSNVCCVATQVQQVTGEELEVAIAGRDTPLVVDFFATWCGPCVLLAQELEKVGLSPVHCTPSGGLDPKRAHGWATHGTSASFETAASKPTCVSVLGEEAVASQARGLLRVTHPSSQSGKHCRWVPGRGSRVSRVTYVCAPGRIPGRTYGAHVVTSMGDPGGSHT